MEKKIFTYSKDIKIRVDCLEQVVDFVCKKHSVQPFQVSFPKKDNNEYYVAINNKLGETFAYIGTINFNPFKD